MAEGGNRNPDYVTVIEFPDMYSLDAWYNSPEYQAQSTVHTVGGVITKSEPIMLIVPDAAKLQVEAKVHPQDIDQVQIGQHAMLRFSAFNMRTTPEVNGTVTRVSADTSTDQRTGQSYYTIRVALPHDAAAQLGDVKLLPGMSVEAFIQTGERTVISYLMKPLRDQFMRHFARSRSEIAVTWHTVLFMNQTARPIV